MTDLRARAEALVATWRASAAELRSEAAADPKRDPTVAVTWLEWAAREVTAMLAALPPDPAPTGERKPCGAWRVDSDGSAEMEAGPFDLATWPAQIGPMVYWEVAFGDLSADVPRQGSENGAEAAQLAAEDAAAELLRAGLRALGLAK